MKLYLFFCVSLHIAYRGNARNIDIPKMKSTSNSTEILFISSTKNIFNSTENSLMSSTENTLNTTEKTMVTKTESKCPKNMVVGRQDSENGTSWICYCPHPFVLMKDNQCAELFRQGPCESGNFVVQSPRNGNPNISVCAPDRELARCVTNPCLEDGLVPDNGTCRNITTNPLCNYGRLYYVEATMEIDCEFVRACSVIKSPLRRTCPPHSRPDRNGECRIKL